MNQTNTTNFDIQQFKQRFNNMIELLKRVWNNQIVNNPKYFALTFDELVFLHNNLMNTSI